MPIGAAACDSTRSVHARQHRTAAALRSQTYEDIKLHDVLLAFGVARRWPDVLSNALTPGWVPTRMGGPGAQDPALAGPPAR